MPAWVLRQHAACIADKQTLTSQITELKQQLDAQAKLIGELTESFQAEKDFNKVWRERLDDDLSEMEVRLIQRIEPLEEAKLVKDGTTAPDEANNTGYVPWSQRKAARESKMYKPEEMVAKYKHTDVPTKA